MQFNDLGLAEPIMKALASKNYVTPTPIQQKAIPVLLEGKDLCGIAQTGTGKTAAFALPSLDYFARNPRPTPVKGCRMLVLAPTRELAAQIAQSFRDYGRFLKLSVETVFGGVPIGKQIRALSVGVDVVVATPGRLLDLIDQRAFTIKDTEIFVLDEADQMMDMGFIHPLKRVAKMLPADRQNLFFSATMPKEIEALAAQFLNNPVKVSVAPQSTTAERVDQQMYFVNQGEKQALLHLVLKSEDIDRALIFTRTKHGADRVVRFLEGAGIDAFAIHGNKSQGQRTTALQAFRQGKVKLLVATDIAARGIDVSGVSHVINFEIPNVAEQYVHRIGRTARAGADGIAISFVADDERPYLKAIEKATRVKLQITPLPENFMEAVRNLPKPAAPKKGPSQTPQQQARRADGQRKYQDGQRQQRGAPDRAHRAEGDAPAKRPFNRRRSGGGVGAHKGAVQRTGAPR
ncbi:MULTISPECIES: DEAD/DEAH box helicase [Sphingobium]|uniref:DEAD/DEAH box helicase n=2 Tax=Sphingobium cupriresistens TaxID=1132417 RepID=A0A0J7Y271_9SPHN|nr:MULTISPECIES: DEAD/DEAH box helicase [Sphingobium]KMS57929.1 DEAD/DEAH box helicase [Sphingobium cupriresistens LL01]MBJ7379014.1 DEAD/DEAH box helicase [Sphingobium sp.]RYM12578.1 DEAD/DEAH box helicase [Sphingobium cupriresistens]WCP15166.1 ATP-dependent RNA helicase RhlE [Sphingobium sp. AntQ-1]